MAGIFIFFGIELLFFVIFLHRKTKLGKKITTYLMKNQGIPKVLTMQEIDERIDEIISEDID
ncbi:MAG: hypothetical protein IJ220_05960 [Clostridia bacterium]|nr:hypothetical protein [Clostridia bacterium]